MSNSIQDLPPKMAKQFADKAKKGEADYDTEGMWLFYQEFNHSEICLLGLDPPIGHLRKMSKIEWESRSIKRRAK